MCLFFTQFVFFVASRQKTFLNVSSGQISTPKFGLDKYPANFNWEWFLLAPEGQKIQIKFESFGLEQSEHCQNDYLEIRKAYFQDPNDPREIQGAFGAVLLTPKCGTDSPKEIHSAGSMDWVHFRSDSNAFTTYKGFKATFTSKYHLTIFVQLKELLREAVIHSYHATSILDLKRCCRGIKIAPMVNDHCCRPLCNNEKC